METHIRDFVILFFTCQLAPLYDVLVWRLYVEQMGLLQLLFHTLQLDVGDRGARTSCLVGP